MVPAMDPNSTNRSSSRTPSRASRLTAPATLAATASAKPSRSVSTSGTWVPVPAVCTTPVSGYSAGMPSSTAASAARSATSQATTSTRAPSASSSARSSSAPGAAGPRRLVSTRFCAPLPASQRATSPPRPPVPPVTSTVPLAVNSPVTAGAGRRSSRLPSRPVPRIATWSSSRGSASSAISASAAPTSSVRGRSTRPPHSLGCSRAAARPRPQTADCAGLVSGSVSPVPTAPEVSVHRGLPRPRSAMACTSRTVSASPVVSPDRAGNGRSSSASIDTAPTRSSADASAVMSAASAVRSVVVSSTTTRRTWAPHAHSASRTSVSSTSGVVTTSQVPDSSAGTARRSGVHPMP